MLFIYQNGVGKYEVVNDQNGKESILLNTTDINEAVKLFNTLVVSQQKQTLMSWDGAVITNYTKESPEILQSPKAKIVNIPVLSSDELLASVMENANG